MSDYWVVESSRCRIIEMSDQWDVGLTSDHWSDISPIRQLSDYRDVGLTECRTNELTRTVHLSWFSILLMLILIVDIIPFDFIPLAQLSWTDLVAINLILKGYANSILGKWHVILHMTTLLQGEIFYTWNYYSENGYTFFYKQFQFLEEALVLVALEESCFTG